MFKGGVGYSSARLREAAKGKVGVEWMACNVVGFDRSHLHATMIVLILACAGPRPVPVIEFEAPEGVSDPGLFRGSITVFAPGADGNVTPQRVLKGRSLGTRRPGTLAVDASGYLYTTGDPRAGDDTVRVFAPDADGGAAPVRVLAGPRTGIANPTGRRSIITAVCTWASDTVTLRPCSTASRSMPRAPAVTPLRFVESWERAIPSMVWPVPIGSPSAAATRSTCDRTASWRFMRPVPGARQSRPASSTRRSPDDSSAGSIHPIFSRSIPTIPCTRCPGIRSPSLRPDTPGPARQCVRLPAHGPDFGMSPT